MAKYVRAFYVDAEQIKFTDEAKKAVKSNIPTTAYGGHIKYQDGVFSVPIHLGEDAKLANEGDWVVIEKETGKRLIVSDEKFSEEYFDEDEVDFDNHGSESDGFPPEEDQKGETKLPDEPPVVTEPIVDTPTGVPPVVVPLAEEHSAEDTKVD